MKHWQFCQCLRFGKPSDLARMDFSMLHHFLACSASPEALTKLKHVHFTTRLKHAYITPGQPSLSKLGCCMLVGSSLPLTLVCSLAAKVQIMCALILNTHTHIDSYSQVTAMHHTIYLKFQILAFVTQRACLTYALTSTLQWHTLSLLSFDFICHCPLLIEMSMACCPCSSLIL